VTDVFRRREETGLLRELSGCWEGDVQIFLYYVPLTKRYLKVNREDWRELVEDKFCKTFKAWYLEAPTLRTLDGYANLIEAQKAAAT